MVLSSGIARNFQWEIGGFGAEPPDAEGKEVWGAKPPVLGDFLQFFNKNNAFLCIFRSK